MSDLNQCHFIGRLGKDPETRYLPSGDAVANFSIACGEKWKDKTSGEAKERTEWININAFGKLAEIVGKYLKKGSLVYVGGKFRTRKWQDKSGADRYSTEIAADQIQMLGPKPSGAAAPATATSAPTSGEKQFEDDDIPF